jgi:hypothetical protein
MATLPKELNFTSKLQALPSSTRTISSVISPNNGTTFNPNGDIISFDVGSRGYLVPNSLYLRYRATILKPTENGTMLGTPYLTPFSRLEVIIGNNVVETIQNYNQVCNMVANCKLNYSQKTGVASAFGNINHLDNSATANGKSIVYGASAKTYDMAGPLNCILSNCENLFPLGLAPAVRIQLTTESLEQMFAFSTTGVNSFELKNLELCYDIVEFGPEVDAVVKSMADSNGELIIKSQSYSSSTLHMPSASSGSLEYSFNQRISSIKSIFAHISPTAVDTTGGARKFSAKDPTASSGNFQFAIGSEMFPPRPLDATNKAGMYMELLQAWGNNGSVDSYNMAITPAEYFLEEGTTDSGLVPGKFYIGANVERLCGSAILTGISSQLSPISLRINLPTATTRNNNVSLITIYDALISLNVQTRQASVKS